MGRLIKNHWARLITLSAATCRFTPKSHHTYQDQHTNTRQPDQVAAALEGFFWPKIFWDFLTKTLDPAVKPVPVLQIINLLFGLFMFAWEWPLFALAGSGIHRSIEARLAVLPLTALAAALLYQGTNPAIYYVVALGVYFWAYSEGEVSSPSSILFSMPCTDISSRSSAPSHGLFRNERDPAKYSSKTESWHAFDS
jgi:hypothetical protein